MGFRMDTNYQDKEFTSNNISLSFSDDKKIIAFHIVFFFIFARQN
jgi:hypothetical protein